MGAGPSRGARPARFELRDPRAVEQFRAAFLELKSRGLCDLMESTEGIPRLADSLVAVLRQGFADDRIEAVAADIRRTLRESAVAFADTVGKVDAWREALPRDPGHAFVGAAVRLLMTLLYFEERGTLAWVELSSRPAWDVARHLEGVGDGLKRLGGAV